MHTKECCLHSPQSQIEKRTHTHTNIQSEIIFNPISFNSSQITKTNYKHFKSSSPKEALPRRLVVFVNVKWQTKNRFPQKQTNFYKTFSSSFFSVCKKKPRFQIVSKRAFITKINNKSVFLKSISIEL